MTANTSLAGGPATRRRRVSSAGFRVFTYARSSSSSPRRCGSSRRPVLGVAHWRWDVLWTPLTAEGGGLRDQILGTLLLMAGVLVLAGTIGVLAGIHLSEMARIKKNGKPSGGLLRTASDILSGFPSIVLGYVGSRGAGPGTCFTASFWWGGGGGRSPHTHTHTHTLPTQAQSSVAACSR